MLGTRARPTAPAGAAALLAVALAGTACTTTVPPGAVAWNDRAPLVAPPTEAPASGREGYLRVETDQDVRVQGSLSYDHPRRPFDLYDADGRLLEADVDNRGASNGESPRTIALPPGRYGVASVWGTVYREVRVEVRPGLTTEVPADVLRSAPPVFE